MFIHHDFTHSYGGSSYHLMLAMWFVEKVFTWFVILRS